MVYARIVTSVEGETYSPISPRRTTIIFVLGDLNCLNIQSGGAGLLPHPKIANIGDYIIVVGLILQVLMFVSFMVCCLLFNNRFRKHKAEAGDTSDIPWQSCLNMLYGTSLAVLVRNIYRVIEFLMGQHGYLLENEWPLYVFDGALMFVVMVGFLIWYPSSLLRPGMEDPSVDIQCVELIDGERGRCT
jgi:RTA1 like protein